MLLKKLHKPPSKKQYNIYIFTQLTKSAQKIKVFYIHIMNYKTELENAQKSTDIINLSKKCNVNI